MLIVMMCGRRRTRRQHLPAYIRDWGVGGLIAWIARSVDRRCVDTRHKAASRQAAVGERKRQRRAAVGEEREPQQAQQTVDR